MISRTYALNLYALLRIECNLVRMVLPRHGTTEREAKAALQHCGIAPDGIAWSVSPDGTFAFGKKSADNAPMPATLSDCLMRWVDDNSIEVACIG